MKKHTYFLISGIVFGIVAAVHLLRAISGTDIVLMGWDVPVWLSWVAVVAAGFLSYTSFHLSAHRK